MKAFYDTKPSTLEPVGNGSFLYRYNIEEVETETEEAHTQWQCEEVTVYAPLTANKITEAVITDKWPSNYEQKKKRKYRKDISRRENMPYDAERDVYTCANGKELTQTKPKPKLKPSEIS